MMSFEADVEAWLQRTEAGRSRPWNETVEPLNSRAVESGVSLGGESSFRRETSRTDSAAQTVGKATEPRRPARVLLALIDKCPLDLIEKMSPESVQLKKDLKMPLVMMCWSCGIMNGNAIVFMKIFGEILNSPEFALNIFFALIIGALGFVCALVQMYWLNMSMKLYNNLDVMPIYQAMILMHMLLSGLVVLDESALYSWV